MKRFLTLILLSFSLYSFSNNEMAKGIIKGRIIDADTDKPLEYTPVVLLNPDSIVVSGKLADETGNFVLSDLEYGNYILKIDFIGYQSVYKNITLERSSSPLELGDIKLSAAKDLDGVKVTAEKSAFTVEIDKKVYDPSKNPVNASGTGLDVMRNVPSIDVDADNNISLRGNQNVNILIDGRPVAMPISQLLQQIPASSIASIEIITNPSAKYDPEGTSGIINIKLKKDQNEGFNGNVNLGYGYGQYSKFNGGLSFNYMKEKFNFKSGINLWKGAFAFRGDFDRTLYGTPELLMLSEDKGLRDNINPYANIGLDYFLNNNNTLYISGGITPGSGTADRSINYEFYENDTLIQASTRTGEVEAENFNTELNAGWQHIFKKKGHTLDLDAKYAYAQNPILEFLNEDITYGTASGLSLLRQNTDQNTISNVINTQLNYVNPLTDSLKFQAGVHYTADFIDKNFYSESYDAGSDSFTPDTALNNDFNFDQEVYAAYAILGRQFKTIGVQAGVRAEQTFTTSELMTTGEAFINDYFSLFPSAHISYGKTPMNQWQMAYSRRINRPQSHEVNPFTTYDDPYNLQVGNPFLRPEFIHVFELSNSLIKENFTLNTTVYYRKINDQKRRYVEFLPGGVSKVSFDNLANSDLKGIELILGYNPGKMFRTNHTFNYWHNAVDDPDLEPGNSNENYGWSVQSNVTAMLPKGWTTMLSGRYRGRMQVTQGEILPAFGFDAAVKKSLFKKRGSITVRAQDIFKTQNFSFIGNKNNAYDINTYRYWESRQVWVSFSYFFGKMIRGKQIQKTDGFDTSDDVPSGGM